MTAVVADQDQAEAAEPTPGHQHLAAWLEAAADADKALRQVVAHELAEDIPALEQDQAKAAKAVEETYAARQGPEQIIADLNARIAATEADRERWQASLTDETPREERAVARFQHAECEADITRLSQQREFAEAQLLPLRDEWNKARDRLQQATAKLEGRKLNATPALAFFAAGLKTNAYVTFRFGRSLELALRDRDHYEHDAAVEHMLHLCRVSGFRTEDYSDVLPSDAAQARRFWDQVYADASASVVSDPAPGMADVTAQMVVEVTNKNLTPDYIEDRTQMPQMPAPPPPRS